MADPMDTNTITTMFPAQDYSLDDHAQVTGFKYELAPQVLAKLSQALPELQTRDSGAIVCSFEWTTHPECEKLKAVARDWARTHFDIIGCDNLIASDFDSLVSMTMARGRSERMPAALKMMVWFFAFDNFVDEPAHMGADTRASHDLVDAVMSVFVLHDNHTSVGGGGGEGDAAGIVKKYGEEYRGYGRAVRVIRESARDWWDEIRQLGMSTRQQCRFVSVFKRYLDANAEQVAFRHRRHIPDLHTYKELRLYSIGWYVSGLTLEFVLGLDLPDEVLEHPLLSALQVATAFHIMFVNDIFSFRKELSDGDLMNLVPVLLWHNLESSKQHILPTCGAVDELVQETVSQALGLVREMDEECVRLMAKIRAAVRGEGGMLAEAEAVERYVDGVSDWLSGNLQWHRISKRYVHNNNNNNPSLSISKPTSLPYL